MIGHRGCFGTLVGIRQALAALQMHRESTALLVSVELSSLHVSTTNDDGEVLTSVALCGEVATSPPRCC